MGFRKEIDMPIDARVYKKIMEERKKGGMFPPPKPLPPKSPWPWCLGTDKFWREKL